MSDVDRQVDGASSVFFQEMTRQTIVRKLQRLDTEELLDLLAHLIIRERAKGR